MRKEKLDVALIMQANFWSVICESVDHGDDSSVNWLVVGYWMAKPFCRVVGMADEHQGVIGAVNNAIELTKLDSEHYLYEYTNHLTTYLKE